MSEAELLWVNGAVVQRSFINARGSMEKMNVKQIMSTVQTLLHKRGMLAISIFNSNLKCFSLFCLCIIYLIEHYLQISQVHITMEESQWRWDRLRSTKFTSMCSICRRWAFLAVSRRARASSSWVFTPRDSLYNRENWDCRHLYSRVSFTTSSGIFLKSIWKIRRWQWE